MALNIVDESTLTVAGTSIGLSSASPTLAAAELLGARQAAITVKTAPVYYRQDGDAATNSDPILYPNDILPVLGDSMRSILTKLRFLRVGATSATLHIRWYDRDTIHVAPVIRGLPVGAETGGIKTEESWLFGKPTLRAYVNASAKWVNFDTGGENSVRYGSYVAKLMGNTQAGYASKAGVYVPVNKMKLADLASFLYVWYAEATEAINPFFAMHVYDPDHPERRADINYSNGAGGGTGYPSLESGWHEFEVTPTALGQLFYYGNNIPDTTDIEAGTPNHTLAEFIADPVFSTYVIGQMEVMSGSYTTSYINPIYVAKIEVNGIDIPLEPSITEQLDIMRDDQAKALTTIPTWTFGEAFLRDSVSGNATWSRWHHQKGAHGWTAKLYGGIQTGYNDWARISVPVNEMPIGDLKSALWTWNNTEEEANGLGMAIYLHDPDDNDLRIEMTQLAAHADVEKAAGWLAHELNVATDYFYWYGEDGAGGGSDISEGVPNYVGLDDFQKDPLFGSWTIYSIDFYWGGQTGSEEYKDIWVADIKINGQAIPIKPDSTGTGRFGIKTYTGTDATVTTGEAKLAPKTPYRLLSISNKINDVQGGSSPFIVNLLSEAGSAYDATLLTDDMYVPTTRKSLYATS